MLQININNNLDDYKENVLAGMDAKHTIFALAGIMAMAICVIIAYKVLHIPIVVAVYLACPIAFLIILTGFGNKDGMSYWQRLRKRQLRKKSDILYYMSTECLDIYKEAENCGEKGDGWSNRKKKQKK